MYATDASNYRHVPIGVVFPRDTADVMTAVSVARKHDAPLLGRGGGTSLAGQCCNVALVLDMSRHMNAILEVDPDGQRARVQPGVILDSLRDRAEVHGLTFGPDPATHDRCTLGGMIGNNSCGVHSIMSGKTDANIESLEVLTYDGVKLKVGPTSDEELASIIAGGGRRGEIYAAMKSIRDRYGDQIRKRFPKIPRNVSGYNLEQLLPENGFNVARALVGTESTCAITLEATTILVPSPPKRVLVVVGYEDVFMAADAVPEIMSFEPIGLEGIDDNLIRAMTRKNLYPEAIELLPAGRGWLLVEFGGVDAGRGGGEGFPAHGEARSEAEEQAELADVRRAFSRKSRMEDARIRPRGDRRRARSAALVGRVGGCRGSAGEARSIPARSSQTHGRVRLPDESLRSLRRRMRPHAHQFRFRVGSPEFVTSAPSSNGPQSSSSASEDRSPGSMETDRPGRSCCRSCSAKS